jgi:NAD(P)-dependent dehydrogenase (short-subunit alcohol dehydrogenase family)
MGAFHMVKAVHPQMCDAGYGRIVLTSSVGGIYGNERCVNYGVSKSGMIGLSAIAALEGEPHGLKSNVIVPAAVTRMAEGSTSRSIRRWTPNWSPPRSPGWRTRPAPSPAR